MPPLYALGGTLAALEVRPVRPDRPGNDIEPACPGLLSVVAACIARESSGHGLPILGPWSFRVPPVVQPDPVSGPRSSRSTTNESIPFQSSTRFPDWPGPNTLTHIGRDYSARRAGHYVHDTSDYGTVKGSSMSSVTQNPQFIRTVLPIAPSSSTVGLTTIVPAPPALPNRSPRAFTSAQRPRGARLYTAADGPLRNGTNGVIVHRSPGITGN